MIRLVVMLQMLLNDAGRYVDGQHRTLRSAMKDERGSVTMEQGPVGRGSDSARRDRGRRHHLVHQHESRRAPMTPRLALGGRHPPHAGERGSTSIQMVMLLPVLFTVMFLGLQGALYYYASNVAGAAAHEGASAASAYQNRRTWDRVRLQPPPPLNSRTARWRTGRWTSRQPLTPSPSPSPGSRCPSCPDWAPGVQVSNVAVGAGVMTSKRNERGSAALEAVIAIPAFLLFVALVIAAGRIAMARQGVQAAAAEASPSGVHRSNRRRGPGQSAGRRATNARRSRAAMRPRHREPRHVRFRGARPGRLPRSAPP